MISYYCLLFEDGIVVVSRLANEGPPNPHKFGKVIVAGPENRNSFEAIEIPMRPIKFILSKGLL